MSKMQVRPIISVSPPTLKTPYIFTYLIVFPWIYSCSQSWQSSCESHEIKTVIHQKNPTLNFWVSACMTMYTELHKHLSTVYQAFIFENHAYKLKDHISKLAKCMKGIVGEREDLCYSWATANKTKD